MSTKTASGAKNEDRREARPGSACVVCGINDARVLSYTRLTDGERVTVCGSHRMAHRRADGHASDVGQLRALVGDRRTG